MRRHRIWWWLNTALLIGGCGSSQDVAAGTSSAASGAGDGPDLVVTWISAPPTTDGMFDVQSTVCNQGTQLADLSEVALYLSRDVTITGSHDGPAPADDRLAVRTAPPLYPGACDTAVTRVYAFFPTGAFYLGAIVDEANAVAESVESNNHFTGPLIGIGHAPDLVVTSVSGPTSAAGSFRVSATVCNQGTLPSADAELRFYVSADATITGDLEDPATADTFLDGQVVDPLSPGQCATASVDVAAPGAAGEFYLGAIVNEDGAVAELIGANNHATGPRIGLGQGPDLVVTSVSGPPSAAGAFHLDATVCNQGTQASAASAVRFYASADPVITGAIESAATPDALLAESAVGGLQPGECAAAPAEVAAPPGPGAYYLGAIVDEAGAIPELIEANNHTTGARIGFGQGPDLVITALSAPSAGAGLPIALTVCNQGTAPSRSAELFVYLSPDPIITGIFEGPFHDDVVGVRAVAPLQPGECDASPVDGGPPYLVGNFYVGAIVDDHDQVHELIESNNHSAVVPVSLGNGADLVVTSLSGPPSANGSFPVSWTVCNQGIQASASTELTFYVSQDATITPVIFGSPLGDWYAGGNQVRPLQPGECDSERGYGSAPGLTGTFYLGAIVDQTNDIPELNEANNAFTAGLIGLGNGPDLVVASVSGPPSANGAFHITSTVCNQGTQPSPGATVQFYASADATITGVVDSPSTPDAALGAGTVGPLQPGQCDTASADTVAPAWTGAFYLGAIVDENDAVPELIEGNNHTAGALIGLGDGPDLVVASVSGPPSADGSFALSSTVCNQGTRPSAAADVRLYVSADTTITGTLGGGASPDVWLAVRPVDALQPGQCDTASTQVTAPAWTGAFHLGAIVDEGNAVAELIESNNQAASATIAFGAGPDLVVTAVSGPPVAQGGFPIASTVCNQGTRPSPEVALSFYVSPGPDVHLTTADGGIPVVLVGSRMVGPLAPGQCDSTPTSAFAWLWNGTYDLSAVVDETDQVAELIESNNRAVGPPIAFGFGPDLLVTAVSGPPSASGSFDVVSTVCNQGTDWASGFVVRLYASADTTITGAMDSPATPDLLLGERWVGWLDAGQCDTASVTVAAPGVTGSYYLGATVDELGYVFELIESNNHTTGAQIALGDGG